MSRHSCATIVVSQPPRFSTPFAPDRVADALFAAAHQDPATWADEIPFDGA